MNDPRLKAFAKIKEPCVRLSKLTLLPQLDPNSKELANALEDVYNSLKSVENPQILTKNLGDYVFFPIGQILKTTTPGDRSTVYIAKILGFLLQHAWSINIEYDLAKQFFIFLSYLISPKKDQPVSNELKAACADALLHLCNDIFYSPTAIQQFQDDISLVPTIAQTVKTLLEYSLTGIDSLEVQISCLECLYSLLFKVINSGEPLGTMLPGIMSSLTKILSPEHGGQRHFSVYVLVFDNMKRLLQVVFNDKELVEPEKEAGDLLQVHSKFIQQGNEKIDKGKQKQQRVRTESWVKANKEQTKLALGVVSTFRIKQRQQLQMKPELQQALLSLSFGILENCVVSLDVCIPQSLDNIMFIVSQDETKVIDAMIPRQAQMRLLALISREVDKRGNKPILQGLQERVYNWIDSLPRLFTSVDEQHVELIIFAIQSGISILSSSSLSGENIDIKYLYETFISQVQDSIKLSQSEKLLQPVLLPEKQQLYDQLTVSSSQTNSSTVGQLLQQQQQPVVAFSDLGLDVTLSDAVENRLSKLVATFGKVASNAQITQRLIEQSSDNDKSLEERAIASWIALSSFQGVVLEKSSDRQFDEWLIEELGDSNKAISQQAKDDLVVEMYNFCTSQLEFATTFTIIGDNNMVENNEYGQRLQDVLTVNAIKGIGLIAEYQDVDLQGQLMDILYPLIDLLGSSNGVIRNCSKETLILLARSCQYQNVSEMVVDNIDYILNSLAIKLGALDMSPQGPVELGAIISIAGPSVLPLLDDVVALLFNILDNYHGYNSIVWGCFKAMEAVVKQTSIAYPPNDDLLLIDYNDDYKKEDEDEEKEKKIHLTSFNELIEKLDSKPKIPDFDMAKEFDKFNLHHHPGKPFKDLNKEGENTKQEEKLKQQQEEEQKEVDLSSFNDDSNERSKEIWISRVPKPTWSIIQQIVTYCSNYLIITKSDDQEEEKQKTEANRFQNLKFQYEVLEMLKLALPILSSASVTIHSKSLLVVNNESKTTKPNIETDTTTTVEPEQTEFFLPIVNEIWPILVYLLNSELKFNNNSTTTTTTNTTSIERSRIVKSVLQIMTILVNLCGDFLSSRIKDLYPLIEIMLLSLKDYDHATSPAKSSTTINEPSSSNTTNNNIIKDISKPDSFQYILFDFILSILVKCHLDTTFSLKLVNKIVSLSSSSSSSSSSSYDLLLSSSPSLKNKLLNINMDAVWFQISKVEYFKEVKKQKNHHHHHNTGLSKLAIKETIEKNKNKFKYADSFLPFVL